MTGGLRKWNQHLVQHRIYKAIKAESFLAEFINSLGPRSFVLSYHMAYHYSPIASSSCQDGDCRRCDCGMLLCKPPARLGGALLGRRSKGEDRSLANLFTESLKPQPCAQRAHMTQYQENLSVSAIRSHFEFQVTGKLGVYLAFRRRMKPQLLVMVGTMHKLKQSHHAMHRLLQ